MTDTLVAMLTKLELWHWVLLILPILLNFWAISHVWSHQFPTPQERSLWFVLTVFLPVVGALIYVVIGRRRTV